MSDPLELLNQDVFENDPTITYGKTTDKGYHRLKMYRNVTSYSIMSEHHSCPRRLLLQRLAAGGVIEGESVIENIHFAFGHAVGAGVQSLWIHRNIEVARWNTFLAWKIPFELRLDKKKKSIWEALIAVEKFEEVLNSLSDEWEVYTLPNGRPGIELSFSLNCRNGYKHYGHIDVLLRSKFTGQVAVLELKTTGLTSAEEALYANSSQALSYSVIVDSIFPGLTSYEVYHAVYSSSQREWAILPFAKSVQQKSEWIKDLLIDHSVMDKYHELKFYPKRGEACFDYSHRCEFFGTCNILPEPLVVPYLDPEEEAEEVDFALDLNDIIKAQQEKL